MLKRNLIIATTAVLALMFTGNAFGQWHKDFPDAYRKNLKAKSNEKAAINVRMTNPGRARKAASGSNTNAEVPEFQTKANLPGRKSNGYIGETEKNLKRQRGNKERKHKPKATLEPSKLEIPNLIRTKSKTTKNLYDWHEDFRRKRPRKRRN